jgi:hypothetical protein
MLDKLAGITSLAASKPMIGVLLKLLGYCVKLHANRQLLLSPDMGTIPVLLNTLKLCLAAGETLMSTGQLSPGVWVPIEIRNKCCGFIKFWYGSRIRGSIHLTNGSGSRSCYFRQCPSRLFEGTFTSFFIDKKSYNSHKSDKTAGNQCFSY